MNMMIQIIAKDGGAKGTGRSISHDVNKWRSGNSFIASPLNVSINFMNLPGTSLNSITGLCYKISVK